MNKIILFSDKYFCNEYSQDADLIIANVTPESKYMTVEEYKQEILNLIELLEKYKPKNVIGNMREMDFTITPNVQAWLDEQLFSCYAKIGVQKLALVLSHDFFTAVSIEQTVDDVKDKKRMQTHYFENVTEAIDWIQQN